MANTNFDATVPMKQFRCPNGVRVWNAPQSGAETRFIFKEIFETRCYEQHGVAIRDGDVILDIGANVGLFALSVMERFRGVKMVCVEPVPNTRACLERNVTESPWRTHHEIAIVANAIGSTTSKTTITYFPRAPGNSTLHLSEKRQEWDRIVDEISPSQIRHLNKLFALVPRRLFTWFMRPLLDHAVTLPCEVCTLSDLIRRQSLERIDLLKIDIEGAEMEALQGIEEQDWQKIQQLAIEVAPAHKDALTPLSHRLRSIGFATVAIESFHGGSVITDDPMPCMLYAVRAPR